MDQCSSSLLENSSKCQPHIQWIHTLYFTIHSSGPLWYCSGHYVCRIHQIDSDTQVTSYSFIIHVLLLCLFICCCFFLIHFSFHIMAFTKVFFSVQNSPPSTPFSPSPLFTWAISNPQCSLNVNVISSHFLWYFLHADLIGTLKTLHICFVKHHNYDKKIKELVINCVSSQLECKLTEGKDSVFLFFHVVPEYTRV